MAAGTGTWIDQAFATAAKIAERKEVANFQDQAAKTHSQTLAHYGKNARKWLIKASSIHDQWDGACSFGAYDVTFSDNHSSDWNSENVYGRNDPMETYAGTDRTISLSFEVPAGSPDEGSYNMYNLSRFIRMALYPKYNTYNYRIQDFYLSGATREEKSFSYGTFNDGPVIKLKMWNWIVGADAKSVGGGPNSSGLLGRITGLTFSPNYDEGVIIGVKGGRKIYPRSFAISFDFIVYDQLHLGFEVNTEQYLEDFGNYPYRAGSSCIPRSSFPPGHREVTKNKVGEPLAASNLEVHNNSVAQSNAAIAAAASDSRNLAQVQAAADAAAKKAAEAKKKNLGTGHHPTKGYKGPNGNRIPPRAG